MGANPHANGGLLLRDLDLPDFRDYAVEVKKPGTTVAEPTRVLGTLPARRDGRQRGARATSGSFGPDETESNRLGAVYEVTDKAWQAEIAARSTSTWPPTAG